MKPSLYKVTSVGKGTLYVMPKPSTEWLEDDILYFKQLGINKLLSLLEENEERELGLEKEKPICLDNNIEFSSFPIRDRGLPNLAELRPVLRQLIKQLKAGTNVSIHCRGGIGRTGIVSCCLLVESGLSALEAIDLVSSARQCSIPDTDEQKEFIKQYQPS